MKLPRLRLRTLEGRLTANHILIATIQAVQHGFDFRVGGGEDA